MFGSTIFIMMYYWRRIAWRLRNRKGKQRIARAAKDAMALKKKNSDTYDIHATASAGTSVTDRVSESAGDGGGGGGCGAVCGGCKEAASSSSPTPVPASQLPLPPPPPSTCLPAAGRGRRPAVDGGRPPRRRRRRQRRHGLGARQRRVHGPQQRRLALGSQVSAALAAALRFWGGGDGGMACRLLCHLRDVDTQRVPSSPTLLLIVPPPPFAALPAASGARAAAASPCEGGP